MAPGWVSLEEEAAKAMQELKYYFDYCYNVTTGPATTRSALEALEAIKRFCDSLDCEDLYG